MADSSVQVASGVGLVVDTRTESTNGNQRQVIVIGDPATNDGVAPVDATAGLKVDLGADNDVTVTQSTGSDLHMVVDSGTVTTVATVCAISSILPGVGATSLGKAEDAAHSSGDTGVMSLAVRNDAGTALAGTTGDYIPLTTNSAGALWVAGGGGTQYAEDTAHSSGDTGTMALAVRRDANTTLVGADGDYAPLQITDSGSLKVAITSGAGTGGTSIADRAAFTASDTSFTVVGGIYQTSEDVLTNSQVAAMGLDVARNVKTHEQYAPTAEDNNNAVIATIDRPVAGSTYAAPTTFAVFGTDVDLAVKASAGNLLSIVATNANAAVRWLQVHNKATAPSSGNVPVLSLPIPAGTANNPGSRELGRNIFGNGGKYLSTGIAIGISTAEATFTAATTTDHDYYGEAV